MTQANDPNQEPTGGEVEDWHGQEAEHDSELADELLEETGGDEAEAERRFEQQSAGVQDPGTRTD